MIKLKKKYCTQIRTLSKVTKIPCKNNTVFMTTGYSRTISMNSEFVNAVSK